MESATEHRNDEAKAWGDQPWIAFGIRTAVFVVPVLLSLAVTWVIASIWAAPASVSGAMGRFVVLALVAVGVGTLADRGARKFLPLAALYRLSLVFPDQAPSRFSTALRSGNTKRIEQRLLEAESGGFDGNQADAAAFIIEVAAALSEHDRLTRGHSERVRAFTALIAEEMGLSAEDSNKLQWAGLIHDVGKLRIDQKILTKPGRLTKEEFDIIKTHPDEGMRIAEPLREYLGEWIGAVGEHHERYDGGGYPNGLAGTDISLGGRIVSVADAYDVITAARSYKKPLSPEFARQELADNAGTQFDPVVVRAFLSISLGRLRRAMWPLSWAAQLPFIGTAVATPVAQTVAAVAVSVAAATGATVATDGFEPLRAPEAIAMVDESDDSTDVEDLLPSQREESNETDAVNAEGQVQAPPTTIVSAPASTDEVFAVSTTTVVDSTDATDPEQAVDEGDQATTITAPSTNAPSATSPSTSTPQFVTTTTSPSIATTTTRARPVTTTTVRPTTTTRARPAITKGPVTTTTVRPTTTTRARPVTTTTVRPTTTTTARPVTTSRPVTTKGPVTTGPVTTTTARPTTTTTTVSAGCRAAQNGQTDLAWKDLGDCDLSNRTLVGVNFSNANLDGANLRNSTLIEVTINGGSFKGIDLRGSTIEGGSFANADFAQTKFAGATIKNIGIHNSNLTGTNFSNTTITDVGFTGTLTKANFSGSLLTRVLFSGVQLNGTNFTDARLTSATLDYSNLSGAIFTRSVMTQVSFWAATNTPIGAASAQFTGVVCPTGIVSDSSCW